MEEWRSGGVEEWRSGGVGEWGSWGVGELGSCAPEDPTTVFALSLEESCGSPGLQGSSGLPGSSADGLKDGYSNTSGWAAKEIRSWGRPVISGSYSRLG